MRSIGKWALNLLDISSKWLRLFLSGILFATGPMLTFDFQKLAEENKAWSGPLSYFTNSSIFWIFITAAFLNALISIYSLCREKSATRMLADKDFEIEQLKSSISQHSDELSEIGNTITQLFDGMLYGLAQQLNTAQKDQIRITLYIHDQGTFSFIPCGRYSPNPRYQDPGRSFYPENQGCISKGWENGWHFDMSVPENGRRRILYHQKEYNMDNDVVDGLSMKSCLYAAKRLHDSSGLPVAVIVVESINPTRFLDADLHATLSNIDRDYGRIIRTLREFIPTPFNAAASGL